jgi:hypothetical protein
MNDVICAAGKTTILYALDNTGNVTTTIPTIGYNIENVVHGKLSLMCWYRNANHHRAA